MSDYKLGMEFIDESAPFAYGFECGRLWEQLKNKESFQQHVHTENSSQIVMMCEYHERSFEFEEMGDGWVNLKVL